MSPGRAPSTAAGPDRHHLLCVQCCLSFPAPGAAQVHSGPHSTRLSQDPPPRCALSRRLTSAGDPMALSSGPSRGLSSVSSSKAERRAEGPPGTAESPRLPPTCSPLEPLSRPLSPAVPCLPEAASTLSCGQSSFVSLKMSAIVLGKTNLLDLMVVETSSQVGAGGQKTSSACLLWPRWPRDVPLPPVPQSPLLHSGAPGGAIVGCP